LIEINFPTDFNTNLLMLFRWLHFVGGVTWLGLLYFFNLVNVPFMKELDPATKGKVLPSLMSRALWWFRWGSVLTVLMGLAYWGSIVASDARNGGASSGGPMGTLLYHLDRRLGSDVCLPDSRQGRARQRPGAGRDLHRHRRRGSWLFLRSTIMDGRAIACSPSASAAAWAG
jgi:hypothetical protein